MMMFQHIFAAFACLLVAHRCLTEWRSYNHHWFDWSAAAGWAATAISLIVEICRA